MERNVTILETKDMSPTFAEKLESTTVKTTLVPKSPGDGPEDFPRQEGIVDPGQATQQR